MAVITLRAGAIPSFDLKETYDGEHIRIDLVPGPFAGPFKIVFSDTEAGAAGTSQEAMIEKDFVAGNVLLSPLELLVFAEGKEYYGDVWDKNDLYPMVRAKVRLLRKPAIRYSKPWGGDTSPASSSFDPSFDSSFS